MRNRRTFTALLAAAAALSAPLGASAQGPAAAPALTLTLTQVVGAEAVALTGNAPANAPLEIALYARFSRDLPDVLLSRRPIASDPAGHYAATMPIAPAYFRQAVVTAIVRTIPAGSQAQSSLLVTAPNVPAPPDTVPPSVR